MVMSVNGIRVTAVVSFASENRAGGMIRRPRGMKGGGATGKHVSTAKNSGVTFNHLKVARQCGDTGNRLNIAKSSGGTFNRLWGVKHGDEAINPL